MSGRRKRTRNTRSETASTPNRSSAFAFVAFVPLLFAPAGAGDFSGDFSDWGTGVAMGAVGCAPSMFAMQLRVRRQLADPASCAATTAQNPRRLPTRRSTNEHPRANKKSRCGRRWMAPNASPPPERASACADRSQSVPRKLRAPNPCREARRQRRDRKFAANRHRSSGIPEHAERLRGRNKARLSRQENNRRGSASATAIRRSRSRFGVVAGA